MTREGAGMTRTIGNDRHRAETTETGSTVPPYPVTPDPITRMDSRLRGNDVGGVRDMMWEGRDMTWEGAGSPGVGFLGIGRSEACEVLLLAHSCVEIADDALCLLRAVVQEVDDGRGHGLPRGDYR